MAKELDKQYSPQNVEDRTYKFWCDHKYFHAEVNPDKKPYTIVIPPPNITGQLHMGHALDETLQDILIRWRRMEGYETLWLPGTDHASIATEAKIVEAMRKEGITKEEIGREKAALWSSLKNLAPPATGIGSVSLWTKDAARPCARSFVSCTIRA